MGRLLAELDQATVLVHEGGYVLQSLAARWPSCVVLILTHLVGFRPWPSRSEFHHDASDFGRFSSVQVEGVTLSDVLANLESAHPGFHERLFDETGALRKFVNVFVADDDVRYLDGVDTKVPDGETVSIIPAVAGG